MFIYTVYIYYVYNSIASSFKRPRQFQDAAPLPSVFRQICQRSMGCNSCGSYKTLPGKLFTWTALHAARLVIGIIGWIILRLSYVIMDFYQADFQVITSTHNGRDTVIPLSLPSTWSWDRRKWPRGSWGCDMTTWWKCRFWPWEKHWMLETSHQHCWWFSYVLDSYQTCDLSSNIDDFLAHGSAKDNGH